MRNPGNLVKDARIVSGNSVSKYFKAFTVVAAIALLAACGQITPDQPMSDNTSDGDQVSWEWSAIGYDDVTVSPTAIGGDFQVRGSGADIWDAKDEFFYVYTPLVGDGSLSVRVKDFSAEHPWAKAGVMLRESLDPAAPNVLLHISSENGSVLQMRADNGGATVNGAGQDATMQVGGWVRLTRTANTVVGELSKDGSTWTELGRYEVAFGEDALIGFAVTAHASGKVATADFANMMRRGRTKPGRGLVNPNPPADEPPTQTPPIEPVLPTPPSGPILPTPPSNPVLPTPPSPTPPTIPVGPVLGDSGYSLPPATLYVATNGSDSNSGRSASSPLRTVTKATTMVRSGDVVYIRGGVYPINVSFKTSGTYSQPIIWASYPGERAIFDGADQARGSSQHRVWVDGVSYNHFVNLEVRNGPQQGIFVRNASNNLFHGVITHGNNGSGIQNYSGNSNRYEYIVTYDNFDTVNSNGKVGEDADGIGISAGDSNVISRVISYFNSDDGIDAWRSTNTLIEYSISYDNGRGANGNGNGFKLGGYNDTNNTVARFNIAFDNRATGFSQNTGRNITLYNNTAFNNAGGNYDVGSTVKLRNNVSISGRNNVVGGADSSSNSWDLGISDVRVVSTDRGSSDFLALRSDSPAIDAGRNVGLPYQGSAPDLGALEYRATIASLLNSERMPITEIVRAAIDSATLAAR